MIHKSQLTTVLLSLILLGGILSRFFSDSDPVRAICIVAMGMPAVLFAVFRFVYLQKGVKLRGSALAFLTAMLVAGVYGIAMGLKHDCRPYYLAADSYHWLFEVVAIAITFHLLLSTEDEDTVSKIMLGLAFAVAAAGILGVAGAYAGVVKHGGYFQGGSRLWHLKGGQNYPQIMLTMVTVLLVRGNLPRHRRFFAMIVGAALLLLMVLTLKRTMWLSFLITLWFVLLRNRQIALVSVLGVALMIPFTTYVIVQGSEYFDVLNFLTYNPNYTVSDTISDRTFQLKGAVRLMDWEGHGFGAEFRIRDPGTNQLEQLHYVHSLFILYALQFGAIVTFLISAAWLALQVGLARSYNASKEWDWLVAGALACNIGVEINGLTLVSAHSVYAGFSLGIGYLALTKSRLAQKTTRMAE